MSEDGYTLTEMLVAMLVIGLMLGGLTQGMHLIGLMQATTISAASQASQLRLARQDFDALFADQGPFATKGAGADRFDGRPTKLSFDCGHEARCGASIVAGAVEMVNPAGKRKLLPLPDSVQAHFVYGSDTGQTATWPLQSDQRELLRWVGLVRGNDTASLPLMSARVLVNEAPTCEFDTITRDCREAGG